MSLEELWSVGRLEERGEARTQGRREHRVGERGDCDEDGDAGVADEVVVADELEQEGSDRESGKALQDRTQREAFERVVQANFLAAMAAMARLPDDMRVTLAAAGGA